MELHELQIEVRNAELRRKGQILDQDLNGTLLTPKLNEVGTWKLELPAAYLHPSGETVEHELCRVLRTDGAGIVASGPGGTILSGPVEHRQYSSATDDLGGTWTFDGVDDLIWIDDELAYGDPSRFSLGSQDAANDTRSGDAETLVLGYIARNIGPLAVAERRRLWLSLVASQGRGPAIKKSPRFQPLLELIQECLVGSRLWVQAQQVEDRIVARVNEGVDRSQDLRLDSRNDQITRTEYSYSAPTLTDVIVGGQGEGTARKMIRRTTSGPTWGRRRERFVDQRNTNDDTELIQAGDEKLAEAEADREAFQVVPNTDLDLVLGRDYNLGDIVSVVVDNAEVPAPITSTPVAVSKGVVRTGATVGNPINTNWQRALQRNQEALARRLSNYERSQ